MPVEMNVFISFNNNNHKLISKLSNYGMCKKGNRCMGGLITDCIANNYCGYEQTDPMGVPSGQTGLIN